MDPLRQAAPRPGPELSVRINPPSGDHSIASDDLDIILPSRQLQAIVLPKVESAADVRMVIQKAEALRGPDDSYSPISLILSVESGASLLNMPKIIEQVSSWKKDHVAFVSALLFASEDYCAATSIIRTKSRRELLFPRAHMATIAKANGLAAIVSDPTFVSARRKVLNMILSCCRIWSASTTRMKRICPKSAKTDESLALTESRPFTPHKLTRFKNSFLQVSRLSCGRRESSMHMKRASGNTRVQWA